MAKLLVGRAWYDLDPNWKCTIGASDDNVIVLNQPRVSRKHAVLECNAGKWRISDLESTNGTFVDGRKIDRPRKLKDGDVILLADQRVTFAQSEPADKGVVASFPQILIENRYRSLLGLLTAVIIGICLVFPVGFSDPVPDCTDDVSRSLAVEEFNKNRVQFELPFFAIDAVGLGEKKAIAGSGNYKVCQAVIVARAEEGSFYNVPLTYDLIGKRDSFFSAHYEVQFVRDNIGEPSRRKNE